MTTNFRSSFVLVLSLAGACGGGGGSSGGPDAGFECPPGMFPQGGECVASTCEHRGAGTAYEVGPDQAYAAVDDVPWEELAAGDTVLIHWREEPYRSKIGIKAEGTEAQPVRVCGVRGPSGQLPVLDGDGATTRAELADFFDPMWTEHLGLILFDVGTDGDWMNGRPSYVEIEGLAIRNVHEGFSYTSASGEQRAWDGVSSGIWVQRGDHITIRNCEISGNNIGLFALSKDDGAPASIVRELLIEGNYIHGNGIVGSDRRHSTYTSVAGVIFQFNRFGEEVEGAIGSALKDRSAGTVIRYNWIESGARTLDLVDPEDAPDTLSADPRFHETFVYGNVLLNRNARAGRMIHYGGDTGVLEIYRKGTLHFYNNTVFIEADQEEQWELALFDLSTPDERVEMRNNVVHLAGTSELNLMASDGAATVHPSNWFTTGWQPGQDDYTGSVDLVAAPAEGADPGFANASEEDFTPAAGSPLLDAAGELAEAAAAYPVGYQYAPHQGAQARSPRGSALDVGAVEAP